VVDRFGGLDLDDAKQPPILVGGLKHQVWIPGRRSADGCVLLVARD
jgi:hypothetical protein